MTILEGTPSSLFVSAQVLVGKTHLVFSISLSATDFVFIILAGLIRK